MSIRLHSKDSKGNYGDGLFSNLSTELEDIMKEVEDFLIEKGKFTEEQRVSGRFNFEMLNSYGTGNLTVDTVDAVCLLNALDSLSEDEQGQFDKRLKENIRQNDSPFSYDGDETWFEYIQYAVKDWADSAKGISVKVAAYMLPNKENIQIETFSSELSDDSIYNILIEKEGNDISRLEIVEKPVIKGNIVINLDWF